MINSGEGIASGRNASKSTVRSPTAAIGLKTANSLFSGQLFQTADISQKLTKHRNHTFTTGCQYDTADIA
jgi:hypothetical protein